MHKNKVVQLLKSLQAEEIRQLDKFVRSPIHNHHNEVVALFQYIRKYINGGQRALQKEQVFAHLYPGEAFNMQKVHYISSYLLKTVEEFLAWQEWRKDEGSFQLHLMRAYNEHHQGNLFKTVEEKLIKYLASNSQKDVNYLNQCYRLEVERFNNLRTQSNAPELRLQELSDAHDKAFIAEKLRNCCILLSNQTVSKRNYQTGMLDEVMRYLENHQYLSIPIISVYYLAIKTITNFNDDFYFLQLKLLLDEGKESFKTDELHDIFIFAINYCIRKLNAGEQDYMKEVFEIYKIGMQVNAFVKNGYMTPRTYSNIIMSGLKQEEFDWVHHFIFNYKMALPETQRDGFFNYNLARFYFEQKNYSEAMPLLLQMEYKDALLTCLGKILLVKMHFEQKETEALDSLLKSFKTYINRKKMTGSYKESYANFLTFTSKLAHTKVQGNHQQLIKEITETKVVAEKEWLLAQLEK